MTEEENISPEEKLLKVIQGEGEGEGRRDESGKLKAESRNGGEEGGERDGDSVKRSALSGQIEGKAGEPGAPPRLRLATADKGASADQDSEEDIPAGIATMHMASDEAEHITENLEKDELVGAKPTSSGTKAAVKGGGASAKDERRRSSGTIGASAQPVDRKKGAPIQFGIVALNRALAFLVLVVVAFAGMEIWANVRSDGDVVPPANYSGVEVTLLDRQAEQELPPVEAVIESFRKRPILGMAPEEPINDERESKPRSTGADKYAKENLNLIGLSSSSAGQSDQEAIIVDNKLNKMYFLSPGQSIAVEGRELVVEEIAHDSVTLSDQFGKVRIE